MCQKKQQVMRSLLQAWAGIIFLSFQQCPPPPVLATTKIDMATTTCLLKPIFAIQKQQL